MKKVILLAAVAALFVGMLAVPASAGNTDAGVLAGTATVGKIRDACNNDGTSNVSGPGLGLPILNSSPKYGFYQFNTPNVVGYWNGLGALNICGDLGPNQDTGLGAHCGMSEGSNGKGKIAFVGTNPLKGARDMYLSNVGWRLTVGGTLPVTGTVLNQAKGSKVGDLTAVVQAQGGAGCPTKSGSDGSKSGGATSFNVVGVWAATEN